MACIIQLSNDNFLRWSRVYGDLTIQELQANGLPELCLPNQVLENVYFPSGFNDVISDVVIDSNGDFIFVGSFTEYNGISVNRIVKLFGVNSANPYSIDTSFNVGTGLVSSATNSYKLTINSDDSVFLYGNGINYNGLYTGQLCKLLTDGSVDGSFNSGTIDNIVSSIDIDTSNDYMYIGGDFAFVQSHRTEGVAVLNLTTGTRETFFSAGFGFSGSVETIKYDSEGEIFVSGNLGSYIATQCRGVAKIRSNGTLDNPPFDTTTGFLDGVTNTGAYQMILDSNENPIVVGKFDSYKGTTRYGVAKVDHDDASLLTTFNPNDGIQSITSLDDLLITSFDSNTAVIYGDFNTYNNQTRYNLVEINKTTATITSTFANGSKFYKAGLTSGKVNTIKKLADGRYLVAGDFIEYGQNDTEYFAIINGWV